MEERELFGLFWNDWLSDELSDGGFGVCLGPSSRL